MMNDESKNEFSFSQDRSSSSMMRNSRFSEFYGKRGDRRNLESPERKTRNLLPHRYNSETKFRMTKHIMPKMSERRERRLRSASNQRSIERTEKKKDLDKSRTYRKIDLQTLISELGLSQQDESYEKLMGFIAKIREDLAVPSIKETCEIKYPSSWIKSINNATTWSNRWAEWTEAEQRLLFGCTSDIECDRWVVMLNWLISLRV